MGLVWAARRSFGAVTARWQAGDTRASPGLEQGKFLEERAPPPAGLPQRPPHRLAPGDRRVKTPPALLLVRSRAPPGFEKSRSLPELSRAQRFLRARGRTHFPAAAGSADPAVAGRRRVSAAPTPKTVPSSAARGRGRPAAAARARPSSATGSSKAERTSSCLCRLLFSTAAAAASFAKESFAKVRSGTRRPLVSCPPGRETSCRCSSSPDFPGRTVAASPRCQQR